MQCFHNTLSRCSYNVACKCRQYSKCTGVFNTWWGAMVTCNQPNLPWTLCDLIWQELGEPTQPKTGQNTTACKKMVTFWNSLRTLFKDLTHCDPRKFDKNYWHKIQFTFIHNLHSVHNPVRWASFRSVFSLLYFSSPCFTSLLHYFESCISPGTRRVSASRSPAAS